MKVRATLLAMAFILVLFVGLPVAAAFVLNGAAPWDCRVVYDPLFC